MRTRHDSTNARAAGASRRFRVLLGMFEAERASWESLADWRARLWALVRDWGHNSQEAFDGTIARLDVDEAVAVSLAWAVALYVSGMIDAGAKGRREGIAEPAAYWSKMLGRRGSALNALETVELRLGRKWPHAVGR